jgi:hypothetical protein
VSLGAYPDFLLTALTGPTTVVLLKENHMRLIEAATLDRKSGVAEGSAVSLNPERRFGMEVLHITPNKTGYTEPHPRDLIGPPRDKSTLICI